MASSSTTTIIASPRSDISSTYDIFLSFSGDTRHNFTDHLYESLKRTNLRIFRDDENIERGEGLQPEIESAIESSKASIVVLSEKYATSTWCLEELWLILEKRRNSNHIVLPVFYQVDPSNVRKHKDKFDIKVDNSSRWTDRNVMRWKAALTEIGNLKGDEFPKFPKSEAATLKLIVDFFKNKLDKKEIYLQPNLIGMDTRSKKVNSWLKEPNTEFFALWGMGGSGKTTLVQYLFESNRKLFDHLSFVENIGSKSESLHGLCELQQQILKDISRDQKIDISNVSQGIPMIDAALDKKKVFIVLDDITEKSQLVALLGTGKFNAESKIIITSRENDVGDWLDFLGWCCQKDGMKLLEDDESLELLIHHLSKSTVLNDDFKKLTEKAVKYCGGNPLALKLLGSSLKLSDTIEFWRSQLEVWENDIHIRLRNVLIGSYESLPDEHTQKLLLHIACFFVEEDKKYVEKILQPDYFAESRIMILINKGLLSVSPKEKLMMHRLLQNTCKDIVCQESSDSPEKRSRVWQSRDSYKILRSKKGSETIVGLALDMKMLQDDENFAFKLTELKTDALNNMHNLKLLKLNYVELNGSYKDFSIDLRWLCWLKFNLTAIPSDLFMGNLVAINMSDSNLEEFKLPEEHKSLKIINLKDSQNLSKLYTDQIPNLENLNLWNCISLNYVSKKIGDLKRLALLNMTGCKRLFQEQQTNTIVGPDKKVSEQPCFPLPSSVERLYLNHCNLENDNSVLLRFEHQVSLQFLNLGGSLFKFLSYYNCLNELRVLDLTGCLMLQELTYLPSNLEELYVYFCESLEKLTFQSHKFALQEFGYDGCISLSEIEGFMKLVPITKLGETDLGHMNWLKAYEYHEVCLVGDDALTIGRSKNLQMLYEFDIMSISMPDIKDPNMDTDFISESASLSFIMPECPKNRRLKGINVTFKYSNDSGDYWVWFAKITTPNGVNLMYNPMVFGKPVSDDVSIWLSYWPIGEAFHFEDIVDVSIVVMKGLKIHGCGVSLVYTDEEVANAKFKENEEYGEILGGDLTGFKLSTGTYYLCRRDFYEKMEVGQLTPDWFTILVGDTIHCTEVGGWKKTGRPKQPYQSYTEVKTLRCISYGPELEEIYKICELSKSSLVDKTLEP